MAKTYYQQHPAGTGRALRPDTLTVAMLREMLRDLPADLPVIFRSPQYGAFGSNTTYSIDTAEIEDLAAYDRLHPAATWIDDETGEIVENEAYTEERAAWRGVVLG